MKGIASDGTLKSVELMRPIINEKTGETETEIMGWRDRWAVFGVHSYNWRWVRRLGQRGCGCTVNPLTRRKVLTRMDCAEHGLSWAELKDCAANPGCCCDKPRKGTTDA